MQGKLIFSALTGMLMAALPARATVVTVTASDLPGCDILVISSQPVADEVGQVYVFPVDEKVSATSADTALSACIATDNPSIPNKLVTVTNLTTTSFPALYYVANGGSSPGTFSNYDGEVNGSLAMQIDNVGVNTPLYSESIAADGVFQAGEVWQFIVQDYNSTVPVDAFFSPGVVGSLNNDVLPSLIVPEPATAVLTLVGSLLLLRRRR